MANQIPLIVDHTTGIIQRLQAGDTLADQGGNKFVRGPASSTDNAIARYDGATGSLLQNSGAIVDDTGQLGLGIAVPEAKLDILHTDGTAETRVTRVSENANGARHRLRKARGSIGSEAVVQVDDTIGTFTFNAWRNGAYQTSDAQAAARILAKVRGPIVGDSVPSALVFATQPVGGTDSVEVVFIEPDGSVIMNSGLTVNETGGDFDTRVEGDTATNLFVVDAGLDAVRIGTTVAGALADFRSTGINLGVDLGIGLGSFAAPPARIAIQGTTGSTCEFRSTRVSEDTGEPRLRFQKARGTPGSEASVQNGDLLGSVTFHAFRNGAYQAALSPVSALFYAEVTGAVSGDSVPADIIFFTTRVGDTVNSQAFRIVNDQSTVTYGGAIINETGADSDTRIEGDSLTHMFFCDASAATENIALVATGAPNWQSMDRGLFVGDASAAPSGNPASGHFYYSNSGVPTFRTSGGAVINLNTSSAYTVTNVTTDRSYDANLTTLDEIADVLGTVIADLQARGLLG